MLTRYRVKNASISYPTDPAIIDRLLAGENIPYAERGMVDHAAGDVVDDIPAVSVPGLLAEGAIEVAGEVASEALTVVEREEAWQDLGRAADDADVPPAAKTKKKNGG